MFDLLLHKYLRVPYRLNVHIDQNPKSSKATILLLHGIGNSGASWDEVVRRLPNNVRVISVDLLGFGTSPSPRWMKYDINVQAKSVIATLLRAKIRQPLIIVGHSMGGLVAVEIAKRFPLIVKSLILCSPPFYSNSESKTLLPSQTAILKEFYQVVLKNPHRIVEAVPLALKLKIVGNGFNVTAENVDVYMAVLEASILHQSSFEDVEKINKPIRLIHARFDPVVIKKNLQQVVKINKNAQLSLVLAGHELIDNYIPAVVKEINEATS
ncbi:MAG TPA: alpha/beta hydrolase [Candidatus Microsaccharimonas sp.]|jgi:pimeloyl-ACP methyl ester carboxylesterase